MLLEVQVALLFTIYLLKVVSVGVLAIAFRAINLDFDRRFNLLDVIDVFSPQRAITIVFVD